ncbi:MAG TPA: hypothetical protein VH723_04465 [Candidatus Limnocylindrales bacterium]
MPLVPPALIAVILVVAFLALIPTRHLYGRGASSTSVASYFLAVWLVGLGIVLAPGMARLLVPLEVVLVIAPYVHLRDGIDRLLGRPPRPVKPPMKNVTPRDEAGERPPAGR